MFELSEVLSPGHMLCIVELYEEIDKRFRGRSWRRRIAPFRRSGGRSKMADSAVVRRAFTAPRSGIMLSTSRELEFLKFLDKLSRHLRSIREPRKALGHALREAASPSLMRVNRKRAYY